MPLKYPVLCAWCRKKGKTTVIGWSDIDKSDGICQPCREEMLAENRRIREKKLKTHFVGHKTALYY